MKYVFSNWKHIKERMQKSGRRLFLFDIDGTLAPIRGNPSAVCVDGTVRALLREMAAKPKAIVGIVSGRRLDDARKIVGLPRLIYVGNHGLEAFFDGRRHLRPEGRVSAAALKKIYLKAKNDFKAIPGVLVEWKDVTLSLHYRRVSPKNQLRFRKALEPLVPMVRGGGLRFRKGKKVVEIVPAQFTGKGSAVRLLKKRFSKPATIFVGDDVTDEEAFAALGAQDVSVCVGNKKKSKARFYMKDQTEIKKLLRRLKDL